MFFKDIFLNPFALQVSNAALGSRPKMTFCSGVSLTLHLWAHLRLSIPLALWSFFLGARANNILTGYLWNVEYRVKSDGATACAYRCGFCSTSGEFEFPVSPGAFWLMHGGPRCLSL